MTEPNAIPILLRPHPFSADTGLIHAAAGQSIDEMLRKAAGGRELAHLEVRAGSHVVPRDLWARVKPKPGTVIEVCGLPQGGMNDNWRAVLMIVVTIVVFAYTGYLSGEGFGLTAAQWGTVAMMTVSAAVPAQVMPPAVQA